MKNLKYFIFILSLAFSGYSVGDTISEDDLSTTFGTCFGQWDGSFGDYKHNSVIWLNLSASW